MCHFYSHIFQETPLKLVNWFQRYEQLKNAKNNRKQKTVSALFGSILKSIFNCMRHFYSYIFQETPLKLVNWFQRYEQLKNAKNNRKQKTFSALFGSILKSIFPSSD